MNKILGTMHYGIISHAEKSCYLEVPCCCVQKLCAEIGAHHHCNKPTGLNIGLDTVVSYLVN